MKIVGIKATVNPSDFQCSYLFIYLYSFVILCCKEKNNTGFEQHEAE